MIYTLDTDTLTFLLKGDERVNDNANDATANGHVLVLSRIVDYEVQRGLLAKKMNKKLREYMNFRQTVTVGSIDDIMWDKAANIYASLMQVGKPINDGDILIAAFSIVNKYTLVTNNANHFGRVGGLKFVNWKDEMRQL